MPTLYLNENVYLSLVKCLDDEGVDSVHTYFTGNKGISDEAQLEYAIGRGYILFSFNRRHYKALHNKWAGAGKGHYGIIVSRLMEPAVLAKRIKEFINNEYPIIPAPFYVSLASHGPNYIIHSRRSANGNA